ncbi:hypothetical protein ACJ77P_11025 [Syntrophus buswellii]|uniref:hypothetical protein n=1 Tax=Syntrophus buswellii TaxID=43774 RepID=UPI0038D3D652
MKEITKMYRTRPSFFTTVSSCFIFASAFLCFFLLLPAAGHTAITTTTITLMWDPPNESNEITGYKIYSGTSPGKYGTTPIKIISSGTAYSCALTVSRDNSMHYYAATAYNEAGLESDFSNEVSYKAPPALYKVTTVLRGCGTGSMIRDVDASVFNKYSTITPSYPSGNYFTAGSSISFQMNPASYCIVTGVKVNGNLTLQSSNTFLLPGVRGDSYVEFLFSFQ